MELGADGETVSPLPPITTFPFTTTTETPDLPDDENCNQYLGKNRTNILFNGGYEGIPENLLINFIGWIILILLFTVLRKKAWNYGRLALVQKCESRTKLLGFSQYNIWTQLFYGNENDIGKVVLEDFTSSTEFNIQIDKGYFAWLPALFKIKEKHILAKSGLDAVQYLSFQQHIIVYMMIICVISIVLVLPINFQGDLEGSDQKQFGHTTLSNLRPSSPFMWIHVTLAIFFLPLGIFFTRRFSKKLEVQQEETSVSKTIMITHVPRRSCHKDTMLRHFQEAYSDVEVVDLQFAYNIRSLMAYDKEKEVARNARIYCETYLKETGRRLDMRPYRCGVICGCCDIFGCPKVDAIQFYSDEERRLTHEVENEKVRALQRPTGVAFITFDSKESAKKVLKDHQRRCECRHNPPTSSVSRDLKPHNWITRVAPPPNDIYWSNLSVTTRHWYLKAVTINVILFIILFFLTTPAFVMNNITFVIDSITKLSPLVSEFLPTLLLWTMAALMPVMVAYSDQFMSHWTRSSENHAVMRKTFTFLLFMVVILPSLGLTSLKAFVEWTIIHNQGNQTYRWQCIFLPDNGAFYVNYIITSAFIGTALEIIRFPELFMYIIRLSLSRSEAENASVCRAIVYEFQFGVQYAWMLLIFAITMIYSVSCPLVTPFGLLYMIFKHLVDKYNIFFAYGPSKISKKIHITALNFVIISIVCLQMSLLFFSVIRNGLNKGITIYSIVGLCITCLVLLTHNVFHWFKDLSPVKYKEFDNGISPGEDGQAQGSQEVDGVTQQAACQFVPAVLRDAPSGEEEVVYNVQPHVGYGTRPMENGVGEEREEGDGSIDLYQNYSGARHGEDPHIEANPEGSIKEDVQGSSVPNEQHGEDAHTEANTEGRIEEEVQGSSVPNDQVTTVSAEINTRPRHKDSEKEGILAAAEEEEEDTLYVKPTMPFQADYSQPKVKTINPNKQEQSTHLEGTNQHLLVNEFDELPTKT
ncbi:transmembrane protein 63 isoform X3 [Oratosquilla oratoria]|uniref:transmembrane protein 63 isoform X3 n=1 Tax=Oratosquilla oratoria TaxID=337810 RepID=UPI003F75DF3A